MNSAKVAVPGLNTLPFHVSRQMSFPGGKAIACVAIFVDCVIVPRIITGMRSNFDVNADLNYLRLAVDRICIDAEIN